MSGRDHELSSSVLRYLRIAYLDSWFIPAGEGLARGNGFKLGGCHDVIFQLVICTHTTNGFDLTGFGWRRNDCTGR